MKSKGKLGDIELSLILFTKFHIEDNKCETVYLRHLQSIRWHLQICKISKHK